MAYTRSESPHYYEFELHRSTGGTYTRVETVDDSSSPANFDNQDKGYWYRAQGRNCETSSRTNCGDWSPWSNSIYLPEPPPDPPTNLSLSIEPGDDDDLDLAYTRSGPSHYYEFELHRSTGGTYAWVETIDDSSSPANFDNQDKGYWYRAQGRNCGTSSRTDCGDWSPWSNTIYLPPDPPTNLNLRLESGSTDDLDLAYTRSGPLHYYEFELHRSTGGTYTRVETVDDSTSPANFDDLSAGTYRAQGRNCGTSSRTNCGDWSVWSNTVGISTVTDHMPDFGTQTIADQTYTVDQQVATLDLPLATGGDPPVTYSISPELSAGLRFDDMERTITGTPTAEAEATTYTYTATDSDAVNPDTDTLQFTITVTEALPLPAVPSGLTVAKLSNTGVVLDWDDVNDATGYEVMVWNGTLDFTQLPAGSITLTCSGLMLSAANPVCSVSTVTVGGLADYYYYFYVRSRNASGVSGWTAAHLVSYAEPEFLETVPDQTYETGQPVSTLQLPEATGKDIPLTYSIWPALPAGLTFDATGRTITGMPTAGSAVTEYTYTATDASTDPDRDNLTFSITVTDGPPSDLVPTFPPGTAIDAQSYRPGQAITTLYLPAAAGGDGTLRYSISPTLPTGLTFNAAARTITGTPTAASTAATYTYTVTDSDAVNPDTDAIEFTISVSTDPVPDFGTQTIHDQTYAVDQAIATLRLPEATGGDGTLRYSIAPALSAGLTFNAAARTISGTPTAVAAETTYTYTVTDSDATNPDTDTLQFAITVALTIPSPDKPTGLSATKLSNETAVIDWDDAAHAAGYDVAAWSETIDWTPLPAGPLTLTCTGLDPAATNPVCTESMATLDGLADRYYYYFFISSRNASGTSGLSSVLVSYEEPEFLETVPDQTYSAGQPTPTLELPEATGRDAPMTYGISPDLPAGLTFDANARTITGTPTAASAATEYTYLATDASTYPDRDRLTFTITVTGQPDLMPEVSITGWRSPFYEGESDSFTVSATGLSSGLIYEIELLATTTDPDQLRSSHGNDIGFNATCSETSKMLAIPGESTSYTEDVTLHACSTDNGGGTVSANLLSGGTAVGHSDGHFVATRLMTARVEADEPFPASEEEVTMTAVVGGPEGATFRYQWQLKSGADWTDVNGATSSQHSVTFTNRGTRMYQVEVTHGDVSVTSEPQRSRGAAMRLSPICWVNWNTWNRV